MNKRMKVLHIIGGGEFGGAEQHILSLVKQYRDSSIEVSVIAFYDHLFAKKLRELGIETIVIQQYGRFDFRIIKEMIRQFKRMQPDLIHTHGVRANFFARIAARRAGITNIVTTVHSILRHDYHKPIPYFFAHLMEKLTQPTSKHYIAVSSGVKEQLLQEGIPENKITIIPNGIDPTSYTPSPERMMKAQALKLEWGIADDQIVIGTSARLVPVKGLSYLIEGVALALKEEQKIHLLILGEGAEYESLKQQANQLGILSHVTFAGFRTDIADCLAAMDIYINCSLSEGTPISVMEAMAAEKALILSHVGGMKQMATNQVSTLFVPPKSGQAIAEAILKLIRDPELIAHLGKAAKKVVEERYSIDMMVQKQTEIYQNVIKGIQ